MPAFIEYDTKDALNKASGPQQAGGLLFVDCNDGGKPSEQSRSRLNRHAAITSGSNGAKKSRLGALQDRTHRKEPAAHARRASENIPPTTIKFRLDKHQKSSSSSPPQTGQKKKPRPRQAFSDDTCTIKEEEDVIPADAVWLSIDPRSAQLLTNSPLGAFQSPSPNVSNDLVATIINWFFYGKEQATSRRPFQVATDHWMKQVWEWGVQNEELFEGVALNVMKKRMDIAGAKAEHKRDYFRHKGQIIRRLRENVETSGKDLDSPTLFVIANMAIHAFQDGDAKAARMHLQALEAIRAPEKIRPYEWVGTWIVDFRLALILGCPPAFSYYLPYDHQNMVPEIDLDELKDRTAESMDLLPRSEAYNKWIRNLAHQLWQFYLAWPKLREIETEPFGMIYNLEFSLRTLHADLAQDQGEHEPSINIRRSIELVIHAIQFHLWIAARYWEPLSWGVRIFVLKKALALLTFTPDFVHNWTNECGGSPSALMWILSMLSVLCIDEGGGLAPIPMLSKVAEMLEITTQDEFLTELERWPWLENWHAVHIPGVWEQVEAYRKSNGKSDNDEKGKSSLWQTTLAERPKQRKLFVGAVEFYDI